MLDDEKFAINADDIIEIIDLVSITKVPNSNASIRGVTNVRGELIPVVDLKIKFGQEKGKDHKKTTLVILNLLSKLDEKKIPIAIITDAVVEIDEILELDILSSPVFGSKIEEKYIKNVVRYNDEYILVLNIDTLLDIKELQVQNKD
jgi:purine-binding chemotaxis protein CheW